MVFKYLSIGFRAHSLCSFFLYWRGLCVRIHHLPDKIIPAGLCVCTRMEKKYIVQINIIRNHNTRRDNMKFTEFNLHESLQTGIAAASYVECTPVQEQVLKGALDGADLYVQSQTGTGKTAAYLTAVIQEMLGRPDITGKTALIMVPTRELAVQVEQEASVLLSATGLKAGSFYGGVGYNKQTALLKKHVDIIIGTPGRVIDLQESGSMDLSNVAFLVIDEADRMFDMGFYPDLRRLIKFLPGTKERQTMLFSATLNTYVKNLAWEYTENAREITIEAEQITVEEIEQQLFHVSSDSKMKLLLGILRSEKPESVIVFCNTKRSCEIVAKRLQMNGIESEFIIGDLPQSKRLQVLNSFKSGSLNCLVATDVAARGIDVTDLAMVVNYDLPNEAENYVHRIGRTARAGKSGKAYTFCSEQDVYNLPAIERYLGNPIPASVAFDDMMAEDKSAGVYIRTGMYGDEERGDSSGGRRRERSGARKPSGAGSGKRGKKTGGSRDDFARNRKAGTGTGSRKRTSGGENRSPDVELSSLSFDERMKVYKEKYAAGKTSGQRNGSARPGTKKSENNTVSRKKTYETNRTQRPEPASGSATSRSRNPVTPAVPAQPEQKKQGFFTKIKKLFSKKTHN